MHKELCHEVAAAKAEFDANHQLEEGTQRRPFPTVSSQLSDKDKEWLLATQLTTLNCYREKHHASFRKKKIELLNHLNNVDLDPRVVKNLVEQIVGHFDELSLECQSAIESVVEELNIPSDTMPVIDAYGEREASMQYAEWEQKMSH